MLLQSRIFGHGWFINLLGVCVQETEKQKQKRDAEEMGDAMKSLENRTLDSKREMDILAALDEMKSMKVIFWTAYFRIWVF